MKTTFLLRTALLSAAVLLFSQFIYAEDFDSVVKLTINSETGVYHKGDTVRVYAESMTGQPVQAKYYLYTDALRQKGKPTEIEVPTQKTLVLEKVYDKSVAEFVSFLDVNDNDKSLKNRTSIGWIIDPEAYTPGFEAPADLQEFWQGQIAKMRKKKIKASLTPVQSNEKGAEKCDLYSLEINMHEGAPCRAYVAIPKGAEPGSLPVILYLHGAGVKKPHCPSSLKTVIRYANMGAIGVDLNAHGMLNGQPQSYYDALDENELKDYSIREPETRENYYFKDMFLRVQRTVDYLTTNQYYDGKHFVVTGSSQGGAQSLFIASMDSRITAAAVGVPAMVDQGGYLEGRKGSWPGVIKRYGFDSAARTVSPYFDPSLMMKYIKGDVFTIVGLIDETCPAGCVYAGQNQLNCNNVIRPYPYRAHTKTAQYYLDGMKAIDKEMTAFIKRHLKD